MNINDLEKALDQSLNQFSIEMQSKVNSAKGEPLNEYDIDDIARNVFYTMNDFKANIVKYLKENNK
ncbi:hypothetical protein AB2T63_12140 [Clostridium butyricum]|uniref:Uncharacterized protein n=1 Tax=Clostridium butyricum TaxID=1492 RepID=A0A2S7FD17_CLOBU|nr:hypothetical protein [Clostridium butyricum]KHD14959.1 hypothetical protein OA81_12730 [Clostridium butyricum]PPV16025.1 hypothetical protein AWN73_10765 [Clostridium butyricum]